MSGDEAGKTAETTQSYYGCNDRLKVMKANGKFELRLIAESGRVLVRDGITLCLDGRDLFCPDAKCWMGEKGYVDITGVQRGKDLTFTCRFGQLHGRIMEVREGNWMFYKGEWRSGKPLKFPHTSILLEGVWKGSRKSFLALVGSRYCLQAVEGKIFEESRRRQQKNLKLKTNDKRLN